MGEQIGERRGARTQKSIGIVSGLIGDRLPGGFTDKMAVVEKVEHGAAYLRTGK